jgi:hypothetical protein
LVKARRVETAALEGVAEAEVPMPVPVPVPVEEEEPTPEGDAEEATGSEAAGLKKID